jgi:ribosomal protein L37AE/L43A
MGRCGTNENINGELNMTDRLSCPKCGNEAFDHQRSTIYDELAIVKFDSEGVVDYELIEESECSGEQDSQAFECRRCGWELADEDGYPITEPDKVVAAFEAARLAPQTKNITEQMLQESEAATDKQTSPKQTSEPTCFGCGVPTVHLHREHCQLECCLACGRQLIANDCVDHAPVRSPFSGHSKIQDLHNVFQVVLNPRGKAWWLSQAENKYELWHTHRWLDGPGESAESYMGAYDTRTEAIAAAEKYEHDERFYTFVMTSYSNSSERIAPLSEWLRSRSSATDQEASNADVLVDLFVNQIKTDCNNGALDSLMGQALAGDWDTHGASYQIQQPDVATAEVTENEDDFLRELEEM